MSGIRKAYITLIYRLLLGPPIAFVCSAYPIYNDKNPVFDKGRHTGTNRCSSLENTTQNFRSKILNVINIFS